MSIFTGLVRPETLPDTLTALSERIETNAKNDPTSFYSYEKFARQFNSGYHNGFAEFVAERANYLAKSLPELMGNL